MNVRQSYDGIDFLISDCLCYPPDTNIAVGNDYVVETVNKQMRIFDKRTGTRLLDEPLRLVLGNALFRGDPYVVYDDNGREARAIFTSLVLQPSGVALPSIITIDARKLFSREAD